MKVTERRSTLDVKFDSEDYKWADFSPGILKNFADFVFLVLPEELLVLLLE